MKKLLLVPIVVLSSIMMMHAQQIFDVPEVICAGQRVDLRSKIKNASSYYWHFCSSNAGSTPSVGARPLGSAGNSPSKTKLLKVGDVFHSFNVIGTGELVRMDYDANMNLQNTINLGDLDGILPYKATSIDIIRSNYDGRWYGLVIGYDPTDDEGYVTRLDFGADIKNTSPIGAYFGKSQYMLRPVDLTIVQEGNNIIAYSINRFSNSLSRIDFGSSIFNNPSITDLGTTYGLNTPTGIVSFVDDNSGLKYAFYSNENTASVGVLEFGTDWTNNPLGYSLGNFNSLVTNPYDITMVRDCGRIFLYVKNKTDGNLVSLEYKGSPIGMTATNLGAQTALSTLPVSLSEIVRTRDRMHFLENDGIGDQYLYTFDTCDASYSFQSSTDQDPDWVKYYTPGFYTIYHIINEGLEDEKVHCETIEVLPMPTLTIQYDSFICQRDTAQLEVIGARGIGYVWTPDYNITDRSLTTVQVWPDSTVGYTCFVNFTNGCIVDTTLKIHVSRVTADAGPDVTVYDASEINIGGIGTSANDTGTYYYQWTPGDEVKKPYEPYTVATPEGSGEFALTVTNEHGCSHSDTTNIWVICDDIHVPNVFSPESYDPAIRQFRILNNALAELTYFRVYNRYGNLLWETEDVLDGWNGYYNGELQPQDNYVWVIEGTCYDGYRIKKQGTVLLLK